VPLPFAGSEICLYDVSGRKVEYFELENSSGTITLQSGQLMPGVYTVVLRSENRMISEIRIAIGR
jgi:hypothetical protein